MHQTGQKTFYKNCLRGLSTLQQEQRSNNHTLAWKFIQLRQQKSRPSAITATYWTCCKTETARLRNRVPVPEEISCKYTRQQRGWHRWWSKYRDGYLIKNVLHNVMRMTKHQLQQKFSNSQETVDVLRQHTVFKNKTIEDLRLMTTAVYEHLNN